MIGKMVNKLAKVNSLVDGMECYVPGVPTEKSIQRYTKFLGGLFCHILKAVAGDVEDLHKFTRLKKICLNSQQRMYLWRCRFLLRLR